MLKVIRRGAIAGLAVAALLVGATYPMAVAIAQTTVALPEPAGSVSLVPVVNAFLPWAIELFMAGIFALASLATAFAKQKWNVDMEEKRKAIEAKYRDSLHSAIYTGVAGVIAKDGMGDKLQINVGSEALASVLRHLSNSVPDAIEFFKPTPEVVARIATAKAVELSAARATVIPGQILNFEPAAPAGFDRG